MAKHASPEDNSFLISIAQHLGAAVALVALVAAAFWGIGQVKGDGGDADGPVVANPSEQPVATTGGTDDGAAAGTDGTSDGPTATDATPDGPTVDPTPPSEPGPEPASETPSPDPDPTSGPTPTRTATSDGAVAPSSVSVQVLDAVLDDGSTAANDVEQRLRADGYRVVANNKASRTYEVTTVFYTPGHEAQARQIADAYGWSKVEPKPDNLSSSVHVHVVVGHDEA